MRKIVVNDIQSKPDLMCMLKEEVSLMNEYSNYKNNMNEKLKLHLYFIREGPYSKEAEDLRNKLDLPFSVFFGGNLRNRYIR